MPKFFIVFCFALFASAAFGASLGKDQREEMNERVKVVCEDIMWKTFSGMMHIYRNSLAEDKQSPKRIAEFVTYGSRAMGKLLTEINSMEFVEENELPVTYEGAQVLCPENVLMKLSEVEETVLNQFLNVPQPVVGNSGSPKN